MSREIGVVAILLARDGKEQEVERILHTCALHSMVEEGCLSYVLHRSVDQVWRFVLVER